jgi:hypothetical protein
MKIEFVKETKSNDESFYFTQVDGKFVDNSLAYDKDKAYSIYQNIVKNKGKYTYKEVLESVEVAQERSYLHVNQKIISYEIKVK